ncbi:fatty acid desaturase family protein [Tessaracoccus caeni]|uniref:fatty acid desaturase family protein n=1 Tax=Tessaracoccus caeni TaxID=3031239 RepID=UPI0023D9AF91|nr:acyl-CoA desaturase [Tessaracoccus caeni]MDF1490353.1 acyl-CoA desaturase [Tessaracoccus caeni]
MTSTNAPSFSERRARIRAELAERTNSFTELAKAVRSEGLSGRTRGFYFALLGGLVVALAGAIAGVVLLGESWFQLLIAAALGVIFTQLAFVGHEAAHRQVLTTGPANDRLGRIVATVGVGMSYSWWMNKHSRHHGNPNKVGKDPDIALGALAFTRDDAAKTKGLHAWVVQRQGWFFLPLLLLAGVDMHRDSIGSLFSRGPVKGRALELTLIGLRFVLYLGFLFWVLPVGMAFAFLGVQLAVFGVYMASSFAPNHIGMPIVEHGAKLDFLDKQVLTSRNVSGGWWMTALMGGLNYQIEHHLFPNMPRPHLFRARQLVREHCRKHGVAYTETTLREAWVIVIRYMNEVGIGASREFRCPTAGALGRS